MANRECATMHTWPNWTTTMWGIVEGMASRHMSFSIPTDPVRRLQQSPRRVRNQTGGGFWLEERGRLDKEAAMVAVGAKPAVPVPPLQLGTRCPHHLLAESRSSQSDRCSREEYLSSSLLMLKIGGVATNGSHPLPHEDIPSNQCPCRCPCCRRLVTRLWVR